MPVLDSHCHLDLMGVDVDEALAAARAVGIDTVVQVGVDLRVEPLVGRGRRAHDDVWAAVALHPNEAGRGAATDEALREIEALAALPQVKAVGETGLDHYRTGRRRAPAAGGVLPRAHRHREAHRHGAGHPRPRRARRRPAGAAARRARPTASSSTASPATPRWPRTCAEHGWFMSFAGPVTFKANDDLRAAARGRAGRAAAGRDRRAVPHADAVPRPAERAVPRAAHRPLAGRRPGDDVDELCAAIAANGRRAFACCAGAGRTRCGRRRRAQQRCERPPPAPAGPAGSPARSSQPSSPQHGELLGPLDPLGDDVQAEVAAQRAALPA